jgi:cytochrome P450
MQATLPSGPRQPATIQTIGWWSRLIPFLERARARYGKRFTVQLLAAPPFVVLSEPDQLKAMFAAPVDVLHPGEGARLLEPVVGPNSVILLDEDAHLEQRKLMLPAFHGERMERLTELVTEVTEREVAAWPRGEPLEMHPRFQALTLEIILRAVFGLDPGPRLDALREALTGILTFGARPYSVLPPLQLELGGRGPWARFVRLRERADRLIEEVIDERRRDPSDRDDVLSMLLEARHEDGEPMSDHELRDELMTLLIAGHETTASELAWAFERLVREPQVLDRLTAELGGGGDAYLTATLQETLRARPVLPNAAPRLVKRETEVGGHLYPAGVCLIASAYLLHHDPDVYPDPYRFRPERFLDEPPGTFSWIPFGGGRRRCLGASFALLEMRIVMRAVLTENRIEAAGDTLELTRRRSITISPGRGAQTVLRDRNGADAAARVAPASASA